MTDIYAADRDGSGDNTLRSLGAVSIPDLDRVTAVAAVPIDADSGRVLAVCLRDRGVDIPGGHRQHEDDDLQATLRRECLEEAAVEIHDPWLIDVVESTRYGLSPDQLTYMVIFGAFIDRLLPFEPSDESSGRELLDALTFLEGYTAGDRAMMARWINAALARRERRSGGPERRVSP